MAVNQELLKKARTAANRLSETERAVEQARAEYHSIVRRMHLAGSSLREIAQALGLSHQRVQQIVQQSGGSWWQRIWRSRNLKTNLVCTFCKRPQSQIAKLIAGPDVFICDQCVAMAEKSAMGSEASGPSRSFAPVKENSRVRCSFCSKSRTADRQVFVNSAGNICGECLDICRQVLEDSA